MSSRKHTLNNAGWIKMWDECLNLVTPERLDYLEAKAVNDAKRITSIVGRIGYGWSGGKDSIVQENILRLAGLEDLPHFCALCAFEYPVMERWLLKHAPRGTVFIQDQHHDAQFLNENPRYLFPLMSDTKVRYEYTREWRTQCKAFCQPRGIVDMFFAKRADDGNFCGAKEHGVAVTHSKGLNVSSWCIIAHWTQEEVMAYIKSRNLPLPPIYDFPNGWTYGTHGWVERNNLHDSITEVFDDVYSIDKEAIYVGARKGLKAAQQYLVDKGEKEYED